MSQYETAVGGIRMRGVRILGCGLFLSFEFGGGKGSVDEWVADVYAEHQRE